MIMSNWKDIEGYDGLFQVSDCGQVRQTADVHKGRVAGLVKQNPVYAGYLQVQLSRSFKLVHRLVAEAFIPNPDNLKTVNHKDRDKTNNHVSNLEWLSLADNLRHAYASGIRNGSTRGERFRSKTRGAKPKHSKETIDKIISLYDEVGNFAEVGRRLGMERQYTQYLYHKNKQP